MKHDYHYHHFSSRSTKRCINLFKNFETLYIYIYRQKKRIDTITHHIHIHHPYEKEEIKFHSSGKWKTVTLGENIHVLHLLFSLRR